MYTIEELRNLSPHELMLELSKARLELYKLRLNQSNNQLKETSKLKLQRKYIARLHTMKCYLAFEAVQKSPKQ